MSIAFPTWHGLDQSETETDRQWTAMCHAVYGGHHIMYHSMTWPGVRGFKRVLSDNIISIHALVQFTAS